MAASIAAQNRSDSALDESFKKPRDASPSSRGRALDQRWSPSQGIIFAMTLQDLVWQPTHSITFSPHSQAPRQSYSTRAQGPPTARANGKTERRNPPNHSHSSTRQAPKPLPYQSPTSSKTPRLQLFEPIAAAEEDLMIHDEDDLGELLERASRENRKATSEVTDVVAEYVNEQAGSEDKSPEMGFSEAAVKATKKPSTPVTSSRKAQRKSKVVGGKAQSSLAEPGSKSALIASRSLSSMDISDGIAAPKPHDFPSKISPNDSKKTERPQILTEEEIERLAQLPKRPVMIAAPSHRPQTAYTKLEMMYGHGKSIGRGFASLIAALKDLLELVKMHPMNDLSLLNPLIIQDVEGELQAMHDNFMFRLHDLRFFMWRKEDLQLTQEPNSARARATTQTLRVHRFKVPIWEADQSRRQLVDGLYMHDRWCRRGGKKFLEKPLHGIQGRLKASRKRRTLRNLLHKIALPWPEKHEYHEAIDRKLNSDQGLKLVTHAGRSWRPLVFAIKSFFSTMRKSPECRERARKFSSYSHWMVQHYERLGSAMHEYAMDRRSRLSQDSPVATLLPDWVDEPDYGSIFLAAPPVSDDTAGEGRDVAGSEPQFVTFKAIGSSGAQKDELEEEITIHTTKTKRAQERSLKGLSTQGHQSHTPNKQVSLLSRQTASGPTKGRSGRASEQLISSSLQKRQERIVRSYDGLDRQQRGDLLFSAARALWSIRKLLDFVKEQKDLGLPTITNVVDLQDMQEEWEASYRRLSRSMHLHRAAVRNRREIMKIITRNQLSQASSKAPLLAYVRLGKLAMLKDEHTYSVDELFDALHDLIRFRRRRGLKLYHKCRKASSSLRDSMHVLGPGLSELSELLDKQSAKICFGKLDEHIVRVRQSLEALMLAQSRYRQFLSSSKKQVLFAKNKLPAVHIHYFRHALSQASSRSWFASSSDCGGTLDSVGNAEVAKDSDDAPAHGPSLIGDPSEAVETRTTKSRRATRRRKSKSEHTKDNNDSFKPLQDSVSSLLHRTTESSNVTWQAVYSDDSEYGPPQPHTPSPSLSRIKSPVISRVLGRSKHPELSPRPLKSTHSMSLAGEAEISKAPVRLCCSEPHQEHSGCILSQSIFSQSNMLGIQVRSIKRSRNLSPYRSIWGKLDILSPGQERAFHYASSYSPAVADQSQIPGMLASSRIDTNRSPLGYRIMDSVSERISRPELDQKPMHWDYTLYRGPLGERVKVHYCKTKADTERISRLFFDEEVLGFDIEWKPQATAKEGIKKNIALIQIASEKRIALFHVARFRCQDTVEDLVPSTFKYIMQTPRITKVGVSIKADCTRLSRFMEIESRGIFELSHLYKLVKYSPSNASAVDKRLVKLATQVEEHLGLPLFKGQDVRASDWSADLTYQQVQYAASDSYAGFQLFHALERKRLSLDPTPPRPYHAELNLPIGLASGGSIPTDDEQTDIEEETLAPEDPSKPPSVEELARDFMKMGIKAPVVAKPKSVKSSPKSPLREPTPEYTTAQNWVNMWRTTLPSSYRPSASPASLRAYALWHEQKYSVPKAAALLRDPPLQNGTVAVYVVEALRLEKLPFEKERLAEAFLHVPEAGKARYKKFIKESGLGDL